MKNMIRYTIISVMSLLPFILQGQFGDGLNGAGLTKGPQQEKDSSRTALPDTLVLQYFKLSDITTKYNFTDSTLNNYFHQYDPAKRRWIDYQNLGNAGSAARNQMYEANPHIGFDAGQSQYDLYNFKLDDFRFFENNIPMSDVSFTPTNGQENFVIRSDFARNFSDGTSISLNYRRIRQLGYYTNQLTKTTNFGASVRYQSDNKRYTGFLSMISNVNEEGQNGGVRADTVNTFYLNEQLGNRINVPINTTDAQTRHQQKQYSLINYYQLNKPSTSKTQLLLRYDLIYDSRYYKFNDETTSSSIDSMEYGDFLREDRGIKLYNKVDRLSNAFYAFVSDGEKLNIRAGLVYDRFKIDQLGLESTYDNLYADFKGDIQISKSISIASVGKLGLGDGAGDFLLKGSLGLDIGEWIELNGGASFYRFTPNLMDRNLVLNGIQIWDNDFVKPVGADIFGDFEIPKLRIKGKIKQSLITNAIYYNTEAEPVKADNVFSATTLSLANEFRFRKLGMENYLMFQVFSDNLYNLPNFYSKHNLHLQGWLFEKALFARVGTEIRISPNHTGADFNPVVGKFHQSDEELAFYPMTDIYFTGKIKTFRFFLRFENIVNLWDNKVQYQVSQYPQFDFKFRFGVSWLLLN